MIKRDEEYKHSAYIWVTGGVYYSYLFPHKKDQANGLALSLTTSDKLL